MHPRNKKAGSSVLSTPSPTYLHPSAYELIKNDNCCLISKQAIDDKAHGNQRHFALAQGDETCAAIVLKRPIL